LTFVRAFGKEGTGNGEFKNPSNIAFDGANKMYVTEFQNGRLQVLSTTGQFLTVLISKSNGWNLCFPVAVALDSKNTVYVSELGRKCVSVFSSQGDYITSAKDEIYCRGLAVVKNDILIMSDQSRDCLYFGAH